jgi:hypothetical protein
MTALPPDGFAIKRVSDAELHAKHRAFNAPQ